MCCCVMSWSFIPRPTITPKQVKVEALVTMFGLLDSFITFRLRRSKKNSARAKGAEALSGARRFRWKWLDGT